MTEVVHKGGRFIIQDEGKKGTESTYLALFTRDKVGEQWMRDNGVTTKKHCDIPDPIPDFTFEVPGRPTIGLEVVNFIQPSDKNSATMRLERIAKKIVAHFKQKGVPLTLLINVVDPRELSAKWSDHLDACANPGFDHLNASDDELKNAFLSALDPETIPEFGIVKKSITVNGQTFVLNASQMHAPHTHYHVNNMGRCTEDPFDEIQKRIDGKNKKFQSYKANCDECDLLIVVDGGFVHLDDELKTHRFESVFRNVFFMDLSFGCKVIKLNILPPRNTPC